MTQSFNYCTNLVYEDEELSYLLTPAGRAIPGEEENEYLYDTRPILYPILNWIK